MPPWRSGAAASRPAQPALAIAEVKTPAAPRPQHEPPVPPAHAPPEATAAAPAGEPGPDPTSHPLVQQAIDLFKARIVDVQPKRD